MLPIIFTLLGKINFSTEVQPAKQEAPISSTVASLSKIISFISPAELKADVPRDVTAFGNDIFSILSSFTNK